MQIPLVNTHLFHFHFEHVVNHIWQSFMSELKKLNDKTIGTTGRGPSEEILWKFYGYCLGKVMSFSTFSEQ